VVELLVLAFLIATVAEAPAQTGTSSETSMKQKAKSKLEEALAEALKNNPDLRVAAAKVHEAEAELHRTKLQVVQKVVNAYRAIDEGKKEVEEAEAALKRLRGLHRTGSVSEGVVRTAESRLTRAKQKLAAAEADLEYLLGKTPRPAGLTATQLAILALSRVGGETSGGASALLLDGISRAALAQGRAKEVKGPVADKIRRALDRKVNVKFARTPLRDVLAQYRKEFPDLHIQASTEHALWGETLTADLKDVPFGAALQLLEDALTGRRVVVREYGLLIVAQDKVPPGTVLLGEFWKGAVKAGTPTEAVQGTVRKVEGGLMTISVGSDAGLAKGHVLEVYRLGKTPKYLGRVRVMEVTATGAVCQALGKMASNVEAGDQVSSKLLPR
jgi:hypothetical protein